MNNTESRHRNVQDESRGEKGSTVSPFGSAIDYNETILTIFIPLENHSDSPEHASASEKTPVSHATIAIEDIGAISELWSSYCFSKHCRMLETLTGKFWWGK